MPVKAKMSAEVKPYRKPIINGIVYTVALLVIAVGPKHPRFMELVVVDTAVDDEFVEFAVEFVEVAAVEFVELVAVELVAVELAAVLVAFVALLVVVVFLSAVELEVEATADELAAVAADELAEAAVVADELELLGILQHVVELYLDQCTRL